MAIDPNKEVSYFVAELEYDVEVPVYEGSEYDSEETTGTTGNSGETGND